MTEIRWGILSTARIGRRAVAPAIRASGNGRLYAVGSRDAARARAYADELGMEAAYGSYQAVLDDASVDAVYIPLPNALHKEWVIRAAEAGKHVLCEKPLALDAAEVRDMERAAKGNGVKLMEAFMYRFHPRSEAAFALVRSGRMGRVRMVRSAFSFALRAMDDIRRNPDLGGGSLMDVGCYCVNATRTLLGAEPEAVQAVARMGPTGVDEAMFAMLRFPDDVIAQFHCALDLPRLEEVLVIGDEGRMAWPSAFLPGTSDVELRLEAPKETTHERFDGLDEYQAMVEHFADCVLRDEAPRYGMRDAAANMAVLTALHASARDGGKLVPVEAID